MLALDTRTLSTWIYGCSSVLGCSTMTCVFKEQEFLVYPRTKSQSSTPASVLEQSLSDGAFMLCLGLGNR